MAKSSIEWTTETDNVIVVEGKEGKPHGWYCVRVSPGCTHCYAARLNKAGRFGGNGLDYKVPPDGQWPPLMLRRDTLARWPRQTKPRMHFVNSMTDTFGEFVPDEWIYEIFDAMLAVPLQTFQVLTKRAERMCHLVTAWLRGRGLDQVPGNIWLGVSVENQEWANRRVPELLDIPAAVRFLSCEPLLGPVDLAYCLVDDYGIWDKGATMIHWVIVGGESGPPGPADAPGLGTVAA